MITQFPFPVDLRLFVLWLGSAGSGVIVSLLLERNALWKAWRSPWKGRIVLLLFLSAPYVSAGLVWLFARIDPAIIAVVQYLLGLGLLGLTAWGSSQYAHGADPETQKE